MNKEWVACQIGSRELYAVPRALHRSGRLRQLITDIWLPPSSLLPLRHRFHADLANANVRPFTVSALAREAIGKIQRRSPWQTVMARNAWFQRRAVEWLDSTGGRRHDETAVLFAYSYAALGIFRWAKERGWRTVLGQIDPGPREEEIVEAEFAATANLKPIWTRAPAEYWEQWKSECELADNIVVNSQWSFDCLADAGVPASNLNIVPLAYEEAASESRPAKKYPAAFTKERPLRVLFLGQVNIRKGVARLLAASSALTSRPVEFWLAGPVQVRVDQAEARWPNVRWFGPVSQRAIGNYYEQADVFILPTLSDGFALTQLEALSYKLPVIASRRCGEVVRDQVDGMILKEASESAIVAAIDTLLNDPGLLQKMSDSATSRPEFTIGALQQHFNNLVDNR